MGTLQQRKTSIALRFGSPGEERWAALVNALQFCLGSGGGGGGGGGGSGGDGGGGGVEGEAGAVYRNTYDVLHPSAGEGFGLASWWAGLRLCLSSLIPR